MSKIFKLHSSNIFSAVLFSAYTLTCLVVFTLPVVATAKVVIVVLLVCAMVYHLWRDVWLLSPSSPVAIWIEADNLTVITRDSHELTGKLSGSSTVTPLLAILNLRPSAPERPRNIVIFPDSMDGESFRELRVLLKWGGQS